MATATATKAAKKQDRTAKLMHVGNVDVLCLTTGKDTGFYMLHTLAADRGAAFHLTKAERGDGPEEEYDVLLDGQFSSCECKGFMRWNHCKHVESLTALVKCGVIKTDKTFAPGSKPAPVEVKAVEVAAEPAKCCFNCDLPYEACKCIV